MAYNLDPITREETLMAAGAGREVETPTPVTRKEMFLKDIADNAGGGGGGGFTPTDAQLAAMNSGITAEKLQTDETNISTINGKLTAHTAGGSNYDTINGIRVYVDSTAPTGDIPTGSIWIGG